MYMQNYGATKFTFHTFHWYSYMYTDVYRPSHFTCKGLACETIPHPPQWMGQSWIILALVSIGSMY